MKSPFPGMDPYIEGQGHLWEGFHIHLIDAIFQAITEVLPANYVVDSQVRAYICTVEPEGKQQHPFVSDLGVSTPRSTKEPEGSVALAQPTTARAAPRTLRAFITEDYREHFLEIYELEPESRLVTTIEVLSPSNKRPKTPGWDQYLRKRQGLLLGEAHLVEIDLLRGGTRMPMIDDWPSSPYTLLVARREQAPSCKVWPAFFDQPLPAIPIPLDAPHPDILIELQPMIDAIYARARYQRRIDYTKSLSPVLSEAESAWLADRLRQRAVM